MDCIGRKQHQWDRAVYTDWEAARRSCSVCGMTGRAWSISKDHARDQAKWWARECDCLLCRERYLRRLAIEEQGQIKEAVRRDEDDVLELYGRKPNPMNRCMFLWQTPQEARKRYPEWQALRTQRLETARQRRLLRQGHRTLTALRATLRHGAVPSPLPESRPARTSPTS